ncbi:MAG TPA: Rho termination factor N-terminal domain-containing protein, partial [Propionibacteriaceae bacterium]|nr:Rho termination factor N-terminal domain-containing protein [Propionibacteriaceae bacterium]
MASGLGIKGASAMRKGDLVQAIQAAQGGATRQRQEGPATQSEGGEAVVRSSRRSERPAGAPSETPAESPATESRAEIADEVGARLAQLGNETAGRDRRRRRGGEPRESSEAGQSEASGEQPAREQVAADREGRSDG